MTEINIQTQVQRWLNKAIADQDIQDELSGMLGDKSKLEDAFYRDLAFGTGGLRGVIGAGTNRMNVYTVAKASQGLSDYVIKHTVPQARSIAVSYDNRIKSDLFAQVASGVFAANGITVHLYDQLMPTPCLSFAVRELQCAAGIMITASHNPAKYNGYKVYNAKGCQITTEAADEILAEIEKLDVFDDVNMLDFEAALASGLVHFIDESVVSAYIAQVKQQSLIQESDLIDKDVAIVYSPLNGTGLKPILRTLNESGFTKITVVKEQQDPDGNFPTCPNPNPEIKATMALGMEYAKHHQADLLLATDPDCDRVGIAVRNKHGDYQLLSGNETGILLLDYIASRRIVLNTLPKDAVMIKTIVTIDLAERIAAYYGVRCINVLTGFKFIGEQIGLLEEKGQDASFIFGFEESYGYLCGTYVRDKDAVVASFLICEMFAYYKSKGISLLEKLQTLYETFGFSLNTLYSYDFEGLTGFTKMQTIMTTFRGPLSVLAGQKIVKVQDYALGLDGLPPSDVLKFILEGNCSIVIRPSGTEPKLKAYISVSASSQSEAQTLETRIAASLKGYFN